MQASGRLCVTVAPHIVQPVLFAYVDPGILGAIYQMVYVAIFGVAAALIFKPWAFIKHTFRRITGRPPVQPETPRDGKTPTSREGDGEP